MDELTSLAKRLADYVRMTIEIGELKSDSPIGIAYRDFMQEWDKRDLSHRDYLRVGIIERHEFNDQDGDISNAAWRLHLKQKARSKYLMDEERERQEIGKKVIPNTHTGRIAEGGKE